MSTLNNTSTTTNTQDIFDIRPAAVKKWVKQLPLGSTGESSKQLYHALRQVNQQQNSLEHHLEFLELISPTLTLLYPRLSKYFTGVSLPLNTKTQNVIHITTSLLTEILLGYQSILRTLVTTKPFGWKKPFSLALHHTFIFSSKIISTKHLTYQANSKGIWNEIFWCYQQATHLKLLNKCFRNCTEKPEKTAIEYEFKKLLLLSLLSANDLGQKNMQEVYSLMPLWIKNSDILIKEPDEKETCFTLNLLSDVPPYLIGTRNDNTRHTVNRHYLSTHKLKTILSKYLNDINDDSAIKLGKNILSKKSIQSLLKTWSRNNLRTEVRKEGVGFVDIITGISAIHFVLNKQDQPAHDEASTALPDEITDFESTLTITPINHSPNYDMLNLNHFLANSDQDEDVWEKVYENNINAPLSVANWTESGIYKVYNFTKSIHLDYNKDGYRLSVNDKKVDSLKHNELIAVREHALAPWTLAQIKWLHFSEKEDVQFGLHILTRHVLPIHIRYHTNGTLCKPLPCLLGLDKKELMLFVPTLPTNLKDKKLQLEHQKQHSHLHLKNKVLSTPAFDIYEVLESHHNETSTAEKIKTTTKITDNIWEIF
ncbi:MAG: hypothetical protein KAT06_08295 [Gammaproteobacteria bacterium]|nr:hypothetical protein [Gammaproteobacteria bacterium]